MDKWILDKILEITSLIKYNGEKRDFIEKALKKFLINPRKDFSVEKEIEKIFHRKDILKKDTGIKDLKNIFSLNTIFEMQDYILTVDVGLTDLFFYLIEKYKEYDLKLKDEIGITIFEIIKFCSLLQNIYYYDLITGNYEFNRNIFSSKEEAYYAYKLKSPDKKSKQTSERASFISKDAFVYFLENGIKDKKIQSIIDNVDKFFNLLSFTIDDIRRDEKIRFQDKPLLQVNEDSYILINEVHLIFGLPYRLDSLLNKYSWYTNNKGKAFEKVVYKVLNEINQNKRIRGKFFPDIRYGRSKNYQLDGLINFEDFSWFIECKGRIPRSDSFKGKVKSVNQDIKKGVTNAEDQAIRAIRASETNQKIGNKSVKEKKGILIIVEGMYPNLNQNPITQFKRRDEKYPRYIISFFTLMEILRQYDVYYLEKFLEWRSDLDMPIYCMSELDYWDYFTQMQNGLDKKEAYDTAKKRNIRVIFNGKRFNVPKFIKEN